MTPADSSFMHIGTAKRGGHHESHRLSEALWDAHQNWLPSRLVSQITADPNPATSAICPRSQSHAARLGRYASNIGLLLMNKLLLSYTSFRRPVFLTMCHMVACVALSGLGDLTGIIQKQHVRTRQQVRPMHGL